MFDDIVNGLAQRFNLGDKARPFLQMLLARISDPARGGLPGFVQRLRTAGMADGVNDWLASPDKADPVEAQDLEVAMDDDRLVPDLESRFGLDRHTVLAALAYAVPALVGRLASGGTVPATLPGDADAFIGNRTAWAATAAAPTPTPRHIEPEVQSRGWLPWVIGAILVVLALGYWAMRDRSDRTDMRPVPEVAAPAAPAAPPTPTVEAEPAGAAVVATPAGVVPVLKVYFDTGKADVAGDFAAQAAVLIEYMNTNTGTTAVISGFNDPTGDPEANARLAKQRAEAVQQALVSAGVPLERTLLEKPAETTGTGATNTASRRVDVVIRE
ncbi:OmpA family protein [Pseudoduganella sp. GCM10020061]|uniref:OmpA family protein n=1 Tax=Pseudoduganella sp. GCM10020061 TaxID=3317345 RepID=UPI00362B30A4